MTANGTCSLSACNVMLLNDSKQPPQPPFLVFLGWDTVAELLIHRAVDADGAEKPWPSCLAGWGSPLHLTELPMLGFRPILCREAD